MFRFLLILAAAAAFFVCTTQAFAQSVGQSPVQYSVSPQVPGPGDTVLIEVEGVGGFLGDSRITWQQDGKTAQTGTGDSSFKFKVGPLGSQTSVSVTIVSATQGTISKTFTFRPSNVELLWEADTSVPPWFMGKALYSAGSSITVTAIPQVVSNGKTISSNSLSFEWQQDGTPLPGASGLGRASVTLKGNDLFASEDISVDVLSGSATVGHGEITIPATKPELVLYARDPLRGVLYDTALQNSASLSQDEVTLRAEPYYFANSSIQNGTVTYDWELNGGSITGPDSAQGVLTLRQTGSGAGQAALEVSAQNTDSDKFIQNAQVALSILFGTSGGSGTSGLSSFFGL